MGNNSTQKDGGKDKRKGLFFSLKSKMLFFFGLIFISILILSKLLEVYGIPLTGFAGDYKNSKQQIFNNLNTIADLKKERLSRWIEERRNDAELVANSPIIVHHVRKFSALAENTADERQVEALLSGLQKEKDYQLLTRHLEHLKAAHGAVYDTIHIADKSTGLIIASTEKKELGLNVSREDYFTNVLTSDNDYFNIRKEVRHSHVYHLYLARAITYKGRVFAILIMKINPDGFIQPILHTGKVMGRTGEAILVGPDMKILSSLKHPLADGTTANLLEYRIKDEPTMIADGRNEGVALSKDYRGVPVLATYRHISISPTFGWVMVVKIDEAEAFAHLNREMFFTSIVGLIGVVIGLVLTIVIANKLSHPIQILSNTAREVEAGNLDARAPIDTSDESGVLAQTFNSMVRRVKEWQEELEEQVRDRTSQLDEVNKSLAREITERKQSEEERVRLSTAIEQAAETIFITDIDGTILYVNPAFEEITGYSKEEAIGRNPKILKSGKHNGSFYQDMWNTLAGGQVWTGHFINKKKDGSFYEEEATISPIRDDSGKIVNYVAVKRDVTQEVLLEKQVQQTQKMEAIGTLAGGIAHDFNNILGIINGYSQMMLVEKEFTAGSLAKGYLENILKAGDRAKDLVNQILIFSRQSEREMRPVRIDLIIKEALKMMRASLPATIEIRQNVESATLALADSTQIHQVLMNLCANAAHSMSEKGGVLEVSLATTELNPEIAALQQDIKSGTYLKITVRDTGNGINPAIIDRIFDPFFTTKEKGEGTGLGLSVVHGIVKGHGGMIDVQSELGKGATLELLLPRIQEEVYESDSEIFHFPFTGNETILLVDDDEKLIEIGQHMLRRVGYDVVSKMNGVEALELFRVQPEKFDLVITDQTMLHMTGEKLAVELMRIRPDIPVILCTGFSDQVTPESIRTIGIRELVMKPVNWIDTSETIRQLLDGTRA
ncbi:MAG: PAS domain S-box protein [Desulfatiglandales bacterium]